MSDLRWKLARLKAMCLREMFFRVLRAGQTGWEQMGLGLGKRPPNANWERGRPWIDEWPNRLNVDDYREAAERILAGRFSVFALEDARLGFPPDWNRDAKTGTMAPLAFGKGIDYRDERTVGDIKYLWEPNRHQELVTLAQAWRLTRDDRYAEGVRRLLESWIEQCPYPRGANWSSSLESAVRLTNWAVVWYLLGGEESTPFTGPVGHRFRKRWLDSVYQHCRFINGYYSQYSSANNHLFGEYMGLFIASLTWPCWPESGTWRDRARRGLEVEAQRQNAPDGVNREQAIWYHHEVADMMLLCGLLGRTNGVEFGPAYWDRLQGMLEYVASIMDMSGNVPMIGDSDDAVMVRFSPKPRFDVFRSLLATGAVLFQRADFAEKAGQFDDKSRWLLGDDVSARFERLAEEVSGSPIRRSFPDSGYYILGDAFETPHEIRLIAESGPLGYLSIAAHGHADALSLTLSAAGVPLLIDPGTYAYHTQEKWRNYFRGTAAHNTVCVDGLDQSVGGGNFLWLRHAQARCLHFESSALQDSWIGEHDGYRRLSDPVTHRREVVLNKVRHTIRVTDWIECFARHDVEIHWHLPESCMTSLQGNRVVIQTGGHFLTMEMPGSPLRAEIVKGREDPPLGWISYRFDKKTPTTTVRWFGEIRGSTELVTSLVLKFPNRTVS